MHGSVDSEVGLLLDHVFCNRLAESLTYAGPSWLLVGLVSTYFLQQFDQQLDSCWTMLDSCWTRLECLATVLRKSIYAGQSWLLVALASTYFLQQFDQTLDSCWTTLDSCWTRLDLFFAAVLRKVGLVLKEVGLWLSSFWLVFCKENCELRQTTRLEHCNI